MRLTRKQKRWMRRHKGLLRFCSVLLVLIIAAVIYIALVMTGVAAVPDIIKNNFGGISFGTDKPDSDVQQPDSDGNQGAADSENGNNNNDNSNNNGNGNSNADKNDNSNGQGNLADNDATAGINPDVIELTTEAVEETTEYQAPEQETHPYYIKVNRIMNCVTIYGLDSDGKYTIPVKAMVCSVGKNDGDTPLDISKTSDKYEFHPMVDGTYGQYAYRFNTGGILFHSVPYYTKDKSNLETEQFNLLGSPASLGCVRLCVRDALWIQTNCPVGTTVEVYDDPASPGPLGKPDMIKIPLDSPYAGWDPTDPDERNPWHQFSAKIEGAEDVTINAGAEYNPLLNVTAKDTCGNDITDKIVVYGSYDCNTPGTYQITYSVTDAIDSTDTVAVTLTVVQ